MTVTVGSSVVALLSIVPSVIS